MYWPDSGQAPFSPLSLTFPLFPFQVKVCVRRWEAAGVAFGSRSLLQHQRVGQRPPSLHRVPVQRDGSQQVGQWPIQWHYHSSNPGSEAVFFLPFLNQLEIFFLSVRHFDLAACTNLCSASLSRRTSYIIQPGAAHSAILQPELWGRLSTTVDGAATSAATYRWFCPPVTSRGRGVVNLGSGHQCK